ncbi:MAG: response regulator [Pseudomonadota bacterium]
MSVQVTRRFLEGRYWIATGAILVVLALTAVFGAYQFSALNNNARYSAAFVELAESANSVERELLNLAVSDQVVADAEETEAAYEKLNSAIVALAEVYTAIRMSDPDADDVEGNSEEDEENEIIEQLSLDTAALEAKYGLSSRGMPFELVAVWEDEDDDEAEGSAEATEEEELLEDGIGEFLGLAIAVLNTRQTAGATLVEATREAREEFETSIGSGLEDVTVAIRASAERSANQATMVLYLGSLFCAIAALASAVFLFRPMTNVVIQSQQDLLKERDRAISSAQGKKDFLAVMSHELRTPMNGVLGFANLTLRTDLNSEQREYVEMIKSSGEGLLELLNSILDLSKIEAGSLELEESNFSVNETVDAAAQLMAAQALEKRLDLSVFIDPELPTDLHGDSGLIRKLVLNLLGNAIKFTETGGVTVELKRTTATSETPADPDRPVEVELKITDTGCGIPQDKLGTIFDRFAQADSSTNRRHEGTGLGLAICREIAALMGGDIVVDSKVGVGSTFTATLKLGHVEPEAPSMRAIADTDLSDAKILVVDDIEPNRRIARLQLQAFGADVVAVASAEAAMLELSEAKASDAPFSVAVIDQMMPNTDGLKLLKMIRDDGRYEDLMTVLSSSAGIRTQADAQALGFDAAAPKPVNQERLIATLARLTLNSDAVVALDAEEGEHTDRLAAEGQRQPQSSKALHVLVVDDNTTNLKLAELNLQNMGYTVDKASNGLEALEAVSQFSYAAILMDVRMPVMDGVEATRRIRQLPAPACETPIVAMTADIANDGVNKLIDEGMDAVIAKPISERALATTLANVINRNERLAS